MLCFGSKDNASRNDDSYYGHIIFLQEEEFNNFSEMIFSPQGVTVIWKWEWQDYSSIDHVSESLSEAEI